MKFASVVVLASSFMIFAGEAPGQGVASALVREGDDATGMGDIINSLSGSAANGIGGYAVRAVFTGEDRILGDYLGGPPTVLVEETQGLFNLNVTALESNFGLSDGGLLAYGPNGIDATTSASGIDCMWIQDTVAGTTTEVARELVAIPTLPGEVYRFNSNMRITRSGIPHWRAGVNSQFGLDNGIGLFSGLAPTVLVRTGDPEPIGAPPGAFPSNNAPSTDHSLSALGTHWMNEVDTELPLGQDAFITIDGVVALTSAGTLIGEAQPLPATSGGLPGENWDNFDRMYVNENGDFFFTGDTDGDTATDEYIALNGDILYREGDTIDGETVRDGLVWGGGAMNETLDIAFAWESTGTGEDVLFLNGEAVLRVGDAVDWDGDGSVEATSVLSAFTGTGELNMSERMGGFVTLFFTADVNVGGVVLEGLLRLSVPADGPFLSFCNGDGGDQMGCTSCPCGNNAMVGTTGGCLNSASSSANLMGSGGPSQSADTMRFELAGAPAGSFALLSSGAAQAPTNPLNPCFGLNSGIQAGNFDGLRCAVQDFQRHGARPVDANGEVGVTTNGWGPPSGPAGGLIAANGFTAGQTRHFQVIYRDDPNLGCGTGLNTSQGVTVTIEP